MPHVVDDNTEGVFEGPREPEEEREPDLLQIANEVEQAPLLNEEELDAILDPFGPAPEVSSISAPTGATEEKEEKPWHVLTPTSKAS